MRFLKYGLAALALCASLPAQAVEFWHSDTVWAGQGMCAAAFTFDSGGETVVNLRVALSAVDKAGNNIDSFILSIPEFGSLSADRYATELWESDVACDDEVKLVVTSATAVVNDERTDLLKNQGIAARAFKPFTIHVGN